MTRAATAAPIVFALLHTSPSWAQEPAGNDTWTSGHMVVPSWVSTKPREDRDGRELELRSKEGRCEEVAGECVAAAMTDPESAAMTEHLTELREKRDDQEGRRARRTGAMVAGITVIGTAGITAIAGGILALGGGTCSGSDLHCTQTAGDERDLRNGGIIAGVGLGTLLLVGVPLTVYGNQSVRKAAPADVAVSLELAPAGGRVSLDF